MLELLAQKAFEQMFNETNEPIPYPKGVEFDLSHTMSNLVRIVLRTLINEKVMRFTFLEQNPYKNSVYGQRAKNGAKIMWVIASYNGAEKWLGRVENGQWYPK
jgi:hypothetical protein